MSEFKDDIEWSSRVFMEKVAPMLEPALDAKIKSVEQFTSDPEMRNYLDVVAGVDAFIVKNSGGIKGLASRVQYEKDVYESFTVRSWRKTEAETELAKFRRALQKNTKEEGDYLYPALFCQAYVDKPKPNIGNVTRLAVVRTRDLLEVIDAGKGEQKDVRDKNGEVEEKFIICRWKDFERILRLPSTKSVPSTWQQPPGDYYKGDTKMAPKEHWDKIREAAWGPLPDEMDL